MPYRSAISGRYIGKAAAARHPNTSIHESSAPNSGSGIRHRSAVDGRYITAADAAKHPKTTVTENG
ncbi:hypothetical protein A5669_15410 [Mycolicibacterium fortuitum]|uniref:hypothetical protein n=1 Tax=Mycolicibacterium fortuitum TaxID=1766 RepID=UPI0007EA843B|nr:hypothetical protein [Mycolicibacterium fortuitum]OBG56726.1 hypothetical protein A5669_15410 [Mycolicibacterium fortuitum]